MEFIADHWRLAAVAALFFLGVAIRRAGWADATHGRWLLNFVFNVGLPILIFGALTVWRPPRRHRAAAQARAGGATVVGTVHRARAQPDRCAHPRRSPARHPGHGPVLRVARAARDGPARDRSGSATARLAIVGAAAPIGFSAVVLSAREGLDLDVTASAAAVSVFLESLWIPFAVALV